MGVTEPDAVVQGFDLVIHGGLVVNGSGVIRTDVGIREGKIASLGYLEPGLGREAIDAGGAFVMPGAVDEHVHPIYLDDLRQTSISALHGGTTSLLHFAYAKPGTGLIEALEAMQADGEGSEVDFGVHLGIFDARNQIAEIPAACERGARSFKMFLTYAALGWMTDDYQLARAMEAISAHGGLAMVHAENGPAIEFLEDEAAAGRGRGSDAVETWLATRPDVLEAEGVFRTISIAEAIGCDVWIPHVTCERSLEVVALARARGARVVAETCPHYLALTQEALWQWGALAKVGPPLRTESDRRALWAGLREGILSAIGSDHAPKEHPGAFEEDLLAAGFGAPAVGTLLPVSYEVGVNGGEIGLVQLVSLVSENPARIFGLYPRKGVIAPGSDADVVVWDPAIAREITAESQHSAAGYTLYEGKQVTGAPRAVVAGGRTLVRDGAFASDGPRGRYLPLGEIDVLAAPCPAAPGSPLAVTR